MCEKRNIFDFGGGKELELLAKILTLEHFKLFAGFGSKKNIYNVCNHKEVVRARQAWGERKSGKKPEN